MRFETPNLSLSVSRALRDFYRRVRFYAFLRFLIGGGILGAILALLAMHADRFLFLSQALREKMQVSVLLASLAYVVVGLITFLLRQTKPREIAYELERELPDDCQERLVTAESLAREMEGAANPIQEQLADNVRRFAEEYAQRIRGASLARDTRLKRRLVGVLAIAAVCFAMNAIPGYKFGLMVQRFLTPGANLPKPSFVSITVEPEEIVVGSGGETVIRANVAGQVPAWLQWLYRKLDVQARQCIFTSRPGTHTQLKFTPENTDAMSRVRRDLFIISRTELEETFSFQIRYADAQTKVRLAEVVQHPTIQRLHVTVVPPEYTELPEEVHENPEGTLRLYPKSEVRVDFWVDQSVPTREITVNERETLDPDWDSDEQKGTWSFTLERETEMEILVENARGFPNKRGGTLTFAIREDQAPTVELTNPSGTISLVPGELVPVRGTITDDLKIKKAVLSYILNPETDETARFRDLPLDIDEDNKGKLEFVKLFDLQETGLAPGDVLQLHIRARDSGNNDGDSQPVTILAKTFARGANEKRRVEALEFVAAALGVFDAAADKDEGGRGIEDQLAELLGEVDELKALPAELPALLELLEREHHFTDAPVDKVGVRHLAFLLAAAQAGEESAPGLDDLRRNLLPWLHFRHQRNLVWRFFGLRREALTLANKMAEEYTSFTERQRRIREVVVQIGTAAVARIDRSEEIKAALRKYSETSAKFREVNQELREVRRSMQQNNNMGGMGGSPLVVTSLEEEHPELMERHDRLSREMQDVRTALRGRIHDEAVQTARETEFGMEAVRALSARQFREFIAGLADFALGQSPAQRGNADYVRAAARRELDRNYRPSGSSDEAIGVRLRRRTSVYFEILQDAGGELYNLSKHSPFLDQKTIGDQQVEINVTARKVSTGDGAAAARNCRQTAAQIDDLLAKHLIKSLPEAAEKAYETLAGFQTDCETVVRGLADTSPAWATSALAREGRMLQREPFLLSPYEAMRNLALRDEVAPPSRVRILSEQSLASLIETGVSREAETLRRIALQRWDEWRRTYLAGLQDVSVSERRVAAALRTVELGFAKEGRPAVVAPFASYLAAYEAGAALPEAPPPLVDTASTEPAFVLADVVLGPIETVSVDAALDAFAAALGQDAAQVGETMQMMQTVPEVDAVANSFAGLAARLVERTDDYQRLIDVLRLQTAYGGDTAADREVMYLALREYYANWVGRGVPLVEEIARTAETMENVSEGVNLFTKLTRLKGQLTAQAKNIQETVEPFKNGEFTAEYGLETYPSIYGLFETTRGYRSVCRNMLASDDAKAVATKALRESEPLSRRFVAMQIDAVERSSQAIDELRNTLNEAKQKRQDADANALRTDLEEAKQALASFVQNVGKAREFDLQREVLEAGKELHERIRVFEITDRVASDPVRRNRAIFDLAELHKEVQALARKLTDMRAGDALSRDRFRGGPKGIKDDKNLWRSVDHRSSRLGRLYGQIGAEVSAAILQAVSGEPTRESIVAASDWAMVGYLMARSSLTGDVVRWRRGFDDEDNQPETLKKWLLSQIEQGQKELRATERMQPFDKVTDEFFSAYADLIRY